MAESAPIPLNLECNGMLFPLFMTTEWFTELTTKFSPRDSDVIICTYPRSGTTWLQHILLIMTTGGSLEESVFTQSPFIDVPICDTKENSEIQLKGRPHVSRSEFDALPDPRILKTHLPYKLTPKNPKTRYIYCFRNPKDNLVSSYYHTCGKKSYAFDGSLEQYLDLWISGRVSYGSWFDHVLEWWEARLEPNTLFLSYEELHTNFKCKIEEIADFLGLKLTEKVFELIARDSEFEKMKDSKLFYYSGVVKERGNGNDLHIRKGVVGGWRNVLTPEQNQKLNETIEIKLKKSSIREKLIFD